MKSLLHKISNAIKTARLNKAMPLRLEFVVTDYAADAHTTALLQPRNSSLSTGWSAMSPDSGA